MPAFFPAILSGLALAAGVMALRLAWGRPQRRGMWLGLAGAALPVALMLASAVTSVEVAVAVLAVTLSVPAFAVVAVNATRRPPLRARTHPPGADDPSVSARLTMRWSGAAVCALAAALATTVAVAVWLPGDMEPRLIFAVLSFPLVWAALAGWILGSRRPARASAATFLAACIAAAAITARQFA
ncbi:hypothetical protein B2G71_10325 [Novosphingobium sp. PC22D]|uniref:hypothetical protein n=1 Tax=Novosphingobium sp. PC22D TaxID=1962403 RepID=UPI000BEF7D0E|nr:hypothetical protein [Novosphingobium sp. PC22D]PEQ12693.1 hypothetical protein B2G71_10325 [Novosphingobium sp. PC22D]